ncbi:hypothetical protein M436DRAFT_86112 [Aureobasidium namibiae CBS 147.97]|uniref:Uncharacterized protein n=1 Tax=Aureobasidium namibiae CBS 147.97 TaxID=1043004 RepID=A0A074X281_9PEZI
MAGIFYSYLTRLSDEEFKTLLKLFTQAWNEILLSETAEVLSQYFTEKPPAPRLHPLHNQDPDLIILEANQSFLRSLRSLRDTNQSYLNILQQGSAKSSALIPYRDMIARLPPTPRIPQLAPRHFHHTRYGEGNSDPSQSPDVAGCAVELSSMGLTGS